jgi:hypothetical protein
MPQSPFSKQATRTIARRTAPVPRGHGNRPVSTAMFIAEGRWWETARAESVAALVQPGLRGVPSGTAHRGDPIVGPTPVPEATALGPVG